MTDREAVDRDGTGPRFERLREMALEEFGSSDSAHDLGHALRVLRNAAIISRAEGGDPEVIMAAALLHDLGCAPKHLGREERSEQRTLELATVLLERAGYPEDKMAHILDIIAIHGYSRGITPDTLEGRILQDADRLDAMGAVGVARTFLVSGSTNRPIYHLEDPWADDRELDDRAYGLDHFFRKLLRLRDGMHTDTGRDMARERHRFLEAFLEQLDREIGDR